MYIKAGSSTCTYTYEDTQVQTEVAASETLMVTSTVDAQPRH
jgi:hypothetical protein